MIFHNTQYILQNLHYGPCVKQVFDLYKAESGEPTPVIIVIHGGGYMTGDRETELKYGPEYTSLYQELLSKGISVASLEYRLTDEVYFPMQMADCARAILHIYDNKGKWNLDGGNIILAGGSAGANIALWLAAGGYKNIGTDVFAEFYKIAGCIKALVLFRGPVSNDQSFYSRHIYAGTDRKAFWLPRFYGVDNFEEMNNEKTAQMIREAEILNFIGHDVPPLYMNFKYPLHEGLLGQDANDDEVFHSAGYGKKIHDICSALGRESILRCGKDIDAGDILRFIRRHTLKKEM